MLNVFTWGAVGPSIVALHPGVGDSRIWNLCAPRWAAAGYQVVAYDRRGFGQTRCSAEPHDDIDDLLAVTNATHSQPAVVVGNSSGGGIALDLAVAHPDHVTALVLLAPSPTGYSYGDWPTAVAEAEQDLLIAAAEKSGELELLNRLETRYWLDGFGQPEGRVAGTPRRLFMEMNDVALHASPIGDRSTRMPTWPLLSQITIPTLVAVGEFDLPGIQRLSAELAESLSAAKLLSITGSAHCPQLDQAEQLDGIVLGFLGSLES